MARLEVARLEELKRKAELEKIEQARELERVKTQAKMLSEQLDLDRAHREHELKIAQQQREIAHVDTKFQHELQRQRADDYFEVKKKKRSDKYEKRSTTMKTILELVKFVPAVILSLIGLFMLSKKAA